MDYTMEQYQQSAQALQQRLGDFRPRVLLILGSGLGALADEVENPICVPYAEVPPYEALYRPGSQGAVCLRKALRTECSGDAGPAPYL